MQKSLEKPILVIIDFVMIQLALVSWLHVRSALGFFSDVSMRGVIPLSLLIYAFWLFIFLFYGQYRTWFTRSRIDEVISVFKTVSIGTLIIFLITFDVDQDFSKPVQLSRLLLISYWGLMIACVSFGRVALLTLHRSLLARGIGLRKSLIVGWGKQAKDVFNGVLKAPALGYEVVGFVSTKPLQSGATYKKTPVLGELSDLNHVIHNESIQEVLIALPSRSKKQLDEVISQCNGTAVGLKIVPDLYDVVIGQVKTNQIYGFPLIEILPELMPNWEVVIKRFLDLVTSFFVLVGFLPFWLFFAIWIRLGSKGPILYSQQRLGKDGKEFKMLKFRSMVEGAEKMTGPVWAQEDDPRITRIGRLMRKLRIDEVPQLINVLKGDMSLVGPRPERPFFVEKLRKIYPLYSRRLRIRPGITGWAQVKGDYDQSLDDVKIKLEYDLFYLENMSLRMDLKIIINTIYVVLLGKGQ